VIDSSHLVAVDVGNSSVKLATLHRDSIRDHAIRHSSARWEQTVLEWVEELFEDEPIFWRLASVRRSAANQLSDAICDRVASPLIQFVTHQHVPMPIAVDHPDRLGIDRLLSAYAASRRFSLPAVVIDAGSAVTVDWISDTGSFCGGAILPGLGLQSRSLATETEALPQLQWDQPGSVSLPAKNTGDAIRGGILVGVSAAIDELIVRYRVIAQATSDQLEVVLTGGDAATISPHLRHNHRVIPNLVCRGLLDLPRSIGAPAGSAAGSS
jgi:type III pantothenate kinase